MQRSLPRPATEGEKDELWPSAKGAERVQQAEQVRMIEGWRGVQWGCDFAQWFVFRAGV